jgi:hypothetical protein
MQDFRLSLQYKIDLVLLGYDVACVGICLSTFRTQAMLHPETSINNYQITLRPEERRPED